MKLINLTRTGPNTYGNPITLDTLWDEAARLGEVSVDHSLVDGQYVEIRFSRSSSGSRVYARGYHSDIREAFSLAIAEARSLGA